MVGGRPEARIIEAKLYPATGTSRPLPRPALDSAKDILEGNYRVILVVAPAGYGKSTQMAQWHTTLAARGIACAWLSLDDGDIDAVRVMRHLIAALQKAEPRIGEATLGQLSGDLIGGANALLEVLSGDLAAVDRRVVLFLDDLQFVQQSDVIEIIDWLVSYGPRCLQFVIGSREEVGLRLSALRVRRQLLEMGPPQMQFSVEEMAQFYRNRLGHDLPMRELRQLQSKTEGWPAALELVALAMAETTDETRFIAQFAGTDRSVVDYLGEVVLTHLDEITRTFVFRIALFDRISAPLAVAATRAQDAEALIDAVRARNLFLIPLDRSATWLRFHHLVGEYFRERYLRAAPTEARECLIRGAEWMFANGFAEEAINCAIRAQDWERATRWVAENVEELAFQRGYHHTILRWMNALPDEWVDRYPVIRIQYVFSLSFSPMQQEYEAQVYRLERLLQRLESEAQRDTQLIEELRCAVQLQAAMSAALRDDGARGGELAAAWLQRWPDAALARKGVMGNVLAFGCKTNSEIAKGLEVLVQTRRWLEKSEGHYSLAWTNFLEALLHLKRGSYLEARRACLSGLEQVERQLHGHPAHASLFHTLLAGVAYEFDEIDRATEHIERAMTSVDEYGPADAVIVAYQTRARLQLLRQDETGALAILREGEELGERRNLRRVVVTLAAEECAILARAGRLGEAKGVAVRLGFNEIPSAGAGASLAADKSFRAASRYLLEQSPKLVIEALGGAIENCRRKELFHRWVALLLLRGLAFERDGEPHKALEDLRSALAIAAPRRYLRLFLDDLTVLQPLIARLDPTRMDGSEAAPLALHLQQSLRKPDRRDPSPRHTPVVEELTKREVAILKRLESGLSNKEIAEAIFISEGTLKWHLHNVYGKLDVKNRSGAMARARTLGIL